MNIIEICLSRGFGGLELYCANTSLEMHNWPDVRVFPVVRQDSFLQKKLRDNGVETFQLERLSHHLPIVAALRLARFIDKHKIDIVHMHWAKDLFLVALAKRLSKRKPRVVYTRQMELTRSKHDAYHRWVYSAVDKFLCITKNLTIQAEKWLPIDKDKIALLYYGVHAPKQPVTDCEEQFAKYGIRKEAFKVGLFGRVEHYKGQHLLLEASRILVGKGHDIQAAIIGRTFEQDYMDNLASYVKQEELEQHYVRIDFMDNPQQLMACFDVVVLTTYLETFGLVLIEAMRAGTAVIGSKAGGVPEIIEPGKTGFLFEPGNAEALADMLGQLLEDRGLLVSMAEQGKKFADATFAYEQHYQQLRSHLDVK